MSRRVKEFVEVRDHLSLDALIERLEEIRGSLPDGSEAELKLRGDDVFGRTLCVSYFREQTEEEAECEARYADAGRESREQELARLQQELGMICYARGGKGKLRAVA